METIVITVTQEHINMGTPAEPAGCPIALALIDKLQLYSYGWITVGSKTCTVGMPNSTKNYALSNDAQKFIIDFDRQKLKGTAFDDGNLPEVAPGTFELTLTNQSHYVPEDN
jgi:hypothetical protein